MEDNEKLGSVFNMALATLEKVNGILKNIANISSIYSEDDEGMVLTPGQAQHLKYRFVKQLYIQSIPLFDATQDKEWKSKMFKRINEIKLTYGKRILNYKIIGVIEAFSPSIDLELDNITIEIQEKLQEHKYFMPSKSDPKLGWKQG